MNDFRQLLREVAQRENAATVRVGADNYVRTVGRLRVIRQASQGALALLAVGGLTYGSVTLAGVSRDGGTPSDSPTPPQTVAPSNTP